MRSVEDMIALRNPPLAPGCNSIGRHLVDLDSHQCRFPVGGDAGGTRFCAVEISPGEWLPGKVNGCYCRFHRAFLARCPSLASEAA